MKRGLAFAVLTLFLASGVFLTAQERRDPPPRPPQTDPATPPAGFPGAPPMLPGGGPPGGFPGFPGIPQAADYKELVGTLVDTLDDADPEVRQSVAQALARIGRQSVNPLIEILKDKDMNIGLRANAAYVLGQIGSQAREAIPALTKAMKEKDKDLRKRAAFAIANIVDEMGVGAFGGPPPGFGIQGGGRAPGQVRDPGVVGPSTVKPVDRPPTIEDKKPN